MGENSYNEKLLGLPDSDCCWIPNQEGTQLIWNGNRVFYDYKEWIYCLLDDFLIPWGYKLSGNIDWYGEEPGDVGRILISDNVIKVIDWLNLSKEYNYTSGCKLTIIVGLEPITSYFGNSKTKSKHYSIQK